jgi:DNA-binding NarL/FixJ family response regulator
MRNAAMLRIAILAPDATTPALEPEPSPGTAVMLRGTWNGPDLERLRELAVRVAILDLRTVETPHIGAVLRDVRAGAPELRIVAVTSAGDHASAQFALASGALALLSRDLTPLTLLRAVNAAARGVPTLGGTGQQAIRRIRAIDPD